MHTSLEMSSDDSERSGLFSGKVTAVTTHYFHHKRASVRKYYADNYRCRPVPCFLPMITIIQFAVFIYYAIPSESDASEKSLSGSPFIYRPDKRYEIWRLVIYMFLHAGLRHLTFNIFIQVVVGLPLEMVHGSVRVSLIYMAGVLAGSLGTSVFEPKSMLVGASGGVYALLAAHLSNVMINYKYMQLAFFRVIGIFVIGFSDVYFAIHDSHPNPESTPVSHAAHFSGAIAGLLIAFTTLRQFEPRSTKLPLRLCSLGLFLVCIILAILYNTLIY